MTLSAAPDTGAAERSVLSEVSITPSIEEETPRGGMGLGKHKLICARTAQDAHFPGSERELGETTRARRVRPMTLNTASMVLESDGELDLRSGDLAATAHQRLRPLLTKSESRGSR